MGRFAYPKSHRLRNRSDYARCKHGSSQSFLFKKVSVYFTKNRLDSCRLGISVSKDKGDSVDRNRFKRWVREAFRLHDEIQTMAFDIHIVPRERVTCYNWAIIQEVLHTAYERLRQVTG